MLDLQYVILVDSFSKFGLVVRLGLDGIAEFVCLFCHKAGRHSANIRNSSELD